MDYQQPPQAPIVVARPATARTAPAAIGVLNGRAISLPEPDYPSNARAARATGSVTVQVVVDESGRVISANAVNGHPVLRPAAVAAARRARFRPARLTGQPISVSGRIVYNFVAQ